MTKEIATIVVARPSTSHRHWTEGDPRLRTK